MDDYNITENFKHSEFTCKCGCGQNNIKPWLVRRLQGARNIYNAPIFINSGCRCTEHNRGEGGTVDSSHLDGLAVDIRLLESIYRYKLIKALMLAGFTRIGIKDDMIHVDIDTRKVSPALWLY